MYKEKVGEGVQKALAEQFSKYNLRGKTWASLTKSADDGARGGRGIGVSQPEGSGPLRYGGEHYKYLVPMFVVMFVFFLVLIVGWVFVAERRQGTLRRLQAAPLTRGHVLMGKMVPCFALSVGQTLFLLIASRLAVRHPLGAGLVAVDRADRLAAAGGALHVAGGDGAGAAHRGGGAERIAGGDVRRACSCWCWRWSAAACCRAR